MDDQVPAWESSGGRTVLTYRGYVLVHFENEDGAVVITTRAYSRAFLNSHRLATEAGARRYAAAWMAKWGEKAMAEVRNMVAAAEVDKAQRPQGDALGRPYPVIEVKHRPTRKRRR